MKVFKVTNTETLEVNVFNSEYDVLSFLLNIDANSKSLNNYELGILRDINSSDLGIVTFKNFEVTLKYD